MRIPLLLAAAQFAPKLFQIRRRTWIAAGVGLLVLFGLLIWAAVALLSGVWGQAQDWARTGAEAAPEAARGVLKQVENVSPGAREALGQFFPAIKPGTPADAKPPRDVTGADLGPVQRYPGMSRIGWHREGKQVAIEYEGEADYAAVLDHYVRGFTEQGYVQAVQSATRMGETHEFTKARERIGMQIAKNPKGGIRVRLDIPLQ